MTRTLELTGTHGTTYTLTLDGTGAATVLSVGSGNHLDQLPTSEIRRLTEFLDTAGPPRVMHNGGAPVLVEAVRSVRSGPQGMAITERQ